MSIEELIDSDPKLTEDEAAKFLGIKANTLSVWRSNKRYQLPYIKVGRLIRYRFSNLQKFLDSRTITPGKDE